MRRNEVQSVAIPAKIFPNLASQTRTAFSKHGFKHRLKIAGRA